MADLNDLEHSGCYRDPAKDEGVDPKKLSVPKLSDLFSPRIISEIKCESRLGKLYCDLYWSLDRRARKTIRHKTQAEAVTFAILQLLEEKNESYLTEARELFDDPNDEVFLFKILGHNLIITLFGGLVFFVGLLSLEEDLNPYLIHWVLGWWSVALGFAFYLSSLSQKSTRKARDQLKLLIRVREEVSELLKLEPPCECSYCFQFKVQGWDHAIIKREAGRRKYLLNLK